MSRNDNIFRNYRFSTTFSNAIAKSPERYGIIEELKFNVNTFSTNFAGWHKIAFAFLKPGGKNNSTNLNKKLKLQLYYPNSDADSKCSSSEHCPMWMWWKKKNKSKYPSVLYVTVRGVISPQKVANVFRSKTPIQGEKTSLMIKFNDIVNEAKKHENNDEASNDSALGLVSDREPHNTSDFVELHSPWSRQPYESCKLPNKCVAKFDSYDEGCFVMRFSWNGLYLACAVRSNDLFVVVVYEVSKGFVQGVCIHRPKFMH